MHLTSVDNTRGITIQPSGQLVKVDVSGTLNLDILQIDGTEVTATADELNILDGVTATADELNILEIM